MLLFIDNRSGQPIYEQICSQVKRRIFSGELCANDALPSIRTLAKDLRISVITTKRAYDELEAEGFIYTVPGKGSFVAAVDIAPLREERLRRMEEHMRAICALAAECALDDKELYDLYLTVREE